MAKNTLRSCVLEHRSPGGSPTVTCRSADTYAVLGFAQTGDDARYLALIGDLGRGARLAHELVPVLGLANLREQFEEIVELGARRLDVHLVKTCPSNQQMQESSRVIAQVREQARAATDQGLRRKAHMVAASRVHLPE